MKPIIIEEIPQSANPTLWKQVERRLLDLDVREKAQWEDGKIEQRDRIANKILYRAHDHLRRNEWDRLWQLLAERGAIAIAAPKQPKPKRVEKHRVRSGSSPQELKDSLHLILSDRWNTVPELKKKFSALYPEINTRYMDTWLLYCARSGLCYAYKGQGEKLAYYANCEATEFDDCWLPLSQALKLARANGYNLSPDYFAAWRTFGDRTLEESQSFYARFGLDYRIEIPDGELNICRWKAL